MECEDAYPYDFPSNMTAAIGTEQAGHVRLGRMTPSLS